MKGFKAFDENLRCKGFQYEIGQTYEMDGEIECCERGFHFCKDLTDCYRHYPMIEDTRICEVEALGEIKTEDNIKYCTNKIKILSEVVNPRIKSNTYTSSSGYLNTGDFNSGDYNSGSKNIGHHNSGHVNSGDWNSGTHNIGHMNSGDWNSGSHHVGVFNCGTNPKIEMFDKKSNWTMRDWYGSKACAIMYTCPDIYYEYDKDQEKTIIHKASTEYKQRWWDNLSEDCKNTVKSLPNFDADKFYLCTGIKV